MNQRLAPTRASTGPGFSEPMVDNLQVADFKTDQIAFGHGELRVLIWCRGRRSSRGRRRAFHAADSPLVVNARSAFPFGVGNFCLAEYRRFGIRFRIA
jgi:hypothetical protein